MLSRQESFISDDSKGGCCVQQAWFSLCKDLVTISLSSFINIGAASLTHIFSHICLVGTISCQVLLAASPAALAPVRQINRSDGSWK